MNGVPTLDYNNYLLEANKYVASRKSFIVCYDTHNYNSVFNNVSAMIDKYDMSVEWEPEKIDFGVLTPVYRSPFIPIAKGIMSLFKSKPDYTVYHLFDEKCLLFKYNK